MAFAPASSGEFVAPVQSIDRVLALTSTVTVCPAPVNELASKKVLSALVGILAPPDRLPEAFAQCEVSLQLPVPFTQNLSGSYLRRSTCLEPLPSLSRMKSFCR